MENVVSNSINKGVPVCTLVDIKSRDLLEISDNKEAVDRIIKREFDKYMDYVRGLCFSSDIDFFYTMAITVDEDTLERKIIFSPNGFISTLMFNLNYDNICKNFDGKTHIIGEGDLISLVDHFMVGLSARIDILKKIDAPNKLHIEFPLLYDKYQNKLKEVEQMKKIMVKLNGMSRKQKREYIKLFDMEQRKTIPGFSLNEYLNEAVSFSLEKFISDYCTTLKSLLDNSDKIMEYIYSHPINFDGLNDMGKNKLELYLAYQFLNMAELSGDDKKQDYLYYVSNYFAENKSLLDSNLSITIKNKTGIKIGHLLPKYNDSLFLTPRILYDRYCQLLVENPNLRAIDFSHLNFDGMSATEVKEFMTEYLKDLSANWDFLPPDDKTYEEEIIKKIRKSGDKLSDEDKNNHQNRLLELFMEKKELYDSSDPFFRVKGRDTFDGYIGFVYSNGRVVLDKFYDDAESGKLADGHAIYAMSIQEFYELSRLSKSQIIRSKLCNRYIHKGNWMDKVLQREIMLETGVDPSVEVKQLIKKCQVVLPEESTC